MRHRITNAGNESSHRSFLAEVLCTFNGQTIQVLIECKTDQTSALSTYIRDYTQSS